MSASCEPFPSGPAKRAWQRVNPGQTPVRKPAGYFQFTFFEYPDVLCRMARWLPGGLIRFGLMVPLLGLLTAPLALPAFVRYRRQPENYVLRVYRWLAPGARS